jgi:hypothetical protein
MHPGQVAVIFRLTIPSCDALPLDARSRVSLNITANTDPLFDFRPQSHLHK